MFTPPELHLFVDKMMEIIAKYHHFQNPKLPEISLTELQNMDEEQRNQILETLIAQSITWYSDRDSLLKYIHHHIKVLKQKLANPNESYELINEIILEYVKNMLHLLATSQNYTAKVQFYGEEYELKAFIKTKELSVSGTYVRDHLSKFNLDNYESYINKKVECSLKLQKAEIKQLNTIIAEKDKRIENLEQELSEFRSSRSNVSKNYNPQFGFSATAIGGLAAVIHPRYTKGGCE